MSVHEDRRDAKTQRIPFEAIVEIGGDLDSGAAFEAQGVNLSQNGMQLRTAYLPEVGQPLLCRFGSGAQEIAAEADVVWRREGPRGGEFGIRFTNLDGASAAALWDMCGVSRGEPADAAAQPAPTEVDPGTRVRLHIDGLGSPMKARVRGATDGELLVGSNLEFLRVGRSLELEDVDRGKKRPAHIDRVDVEVDRASKVPQLVVTLRYDDVPQDPRTQSMHPPAPAEPAQRLDKAAVERAPSLPVIGGPAEPHTASQLADATLQEEIEAARAMRSKFSTAAADIMPKVSELGARAKTALGLLLSKTRERTRAAPAAPRRTTSPPPTGALHATGKRVVRDGEDDAEMPPAKQKLGRKAVIALGGAASVLVSIIAVAALAKSKTPPPGAAAAETLAAATASANPAAEAPPSSGPVQANVPLFGPTTLSTTEPVAPAVPDLTAANAVPTAIPPGGSAVNPSSPVEEVDDEKPESEHGGKGSGAKSHSKVASFGHGKVVHPTFLRVKTDGEISELHGARSSTGFTVSIPGRRAEAGASLVSRDPRLASVKVTHGAKGSEITVQFKDGIPGYLVRAKGHDVQIALSRPEDENVSKDNAKEVAKEKDKDKELKHGATAKKAGKEEHHRSKGH